LHAEADTYSASIDDLAAREEAALPPHDPIRDALDRVAQDPGAIFEGLVLTAIREVRQADPAGYARIRAEAKTLKVSVGELDRLTVPEREGSRGQIFTDVEPWSESVDGAELLADISRVLHQHVIADAPTITAAALWAVHTWCMDALTVSPLAHITAPEKRCGKTVLLTALYRLTYRPLAVSNISPAALFRSMELWQPTLLIDEADTFLRDNEEARGLINSGLYRETAFVLRTVGDDHTPTAFRTWGAKVICGIGKLADTIEDRSIPLRMRRKVPGESVTNIRLSDRHVWGNLQARMARWADDNREAIAASRPEFALGLNDRAQDCWEPLLAIADLSGGEWAGRARAAALALHGVEEESPSIGVELLRDIKTVFDERGASRIASKELLRALTDDEETPWATWNRGKPLAVRQLAARLNEFGIGPKTARLPGGERLKGYLLADFRDAFRRYLSTDAPFTSVTPCQPHNGAASEASSPVTQAPTARIEEAPKPTSDMGCHDVTDESTHSAERDKAGEQTGSVTI